MKLRLIPHIRIFPLLAWLVMSFLLGSHSLAAQGAPDTVVVESGQTDPPPAVMDDSTEEEEEDPEDQRFIPVQDREPFRVQERRLPSGYAEDLKKDDDFWYANKDFSKKKPKDKKPEPDAQSYTPFMQRSWVQTLLWIIIVGGFAFAVMWYLVDNNVGLFRKKNVSAPAEAGGEEEMPEDIFAINYQKEIDKALAQGNYRLAVRIQFLRMLRILADKKIVQYKQDKTNLDYLMELSSKNYYPAFFRLTRHFEYSWYGHFEVGADTYHRIAAEFSQFEKQV